ncbi:MAG TPA: anthranilate synthase component I family protein [Pirellulales bacterium]|jgi:para-aminobenzoate synthetase component 1
MIQQTHSKPRGTADARRDGESPTLNDWPGIVVELRPAPDPSEAFRRLAGLPQCIFFDSALADPELGRYSFIAADPFQWITSNPDDPSLWQRIQHCLETYTVPTLPDLPPFQGGAAGLFSYDLLRSLERLPKPRFDEFQVPDLALGLYDVVLAFDHLSGRAWIISQGFPETDPVLRHRLAQARAAQIQGRLETSDHSASLSAAARPYSSNAQHEGPVPIASLAPQFPVGNLSSLTSNFSQEDYLAMVRRAIEYIYAGDVFQVNLAQRLLYPAQDDSVSLYLRLRQYNPAPFAAYFDLGNFQIASASPERFLKVCDGYVETRPIKGTRPLLHDPQADHRAAEELLSSPKDRAENVMIVDLLRNDLSRVCRYHSVIVSDLCRLERYAFVQHLVSVVRGQLRAGCGPLDLVRAAFPGGSVTGVPKIRAMQIIAELEPTARGPYCGSLGYLGFDGAMDISILIRTIVAGRGWWQLPVGGGIVAESDPEREYKETWTKAAGLLRALS